MQGHQHTADELLRLGALPTPSSAAFAEARGHPKLASRIRRTRDDPLLKWLTSIGCEAYFARILHAGYDFQFIKAHGFDKDDLAALQIPLKGHEKKLLAKYNFPGDASSPREEDDDAESEGDDDDSGNNSGSNSGSDDDSEDDDDDGSSDDDDDSDDDDS